VLVPLFPDIHDTHEDEKIDTVHPRWKYFGGGDHVRQYGKQDLIERLAAARFKVDPLDMDFFGQDVFREAGIAGNSVLYVLRKHGAAGMVTEGQAGPAAGLARSSLRARQGTSNPPHELLPSVDHQGGKRQRGEKP
jgi:hypothetical protein